MPAHRAGLFQSLPYWRGRSSGTGRHNVRGSPGLPLVPAAGIGGRRSTPAHDQSLVYGRDGFDSAEKTSDRRILQYGQNLPPVAPIASLSARHNAHKYMG